MSPRRRKIMLGTVSVCIAVLVGTGISLWKTSGNMISGYTPSTAPSSQVTHAPTERTGSLAHVASSAAESASPASLQLKRVRQWCRQTEPLDSGAIEELCVFLVETPEVEGMSGEGAAELKNAIMNKLGRQASPERFEAVLLRIEGDTARQPEGSRDYALQHLSAWYDQLPNQAAAREVFWQRALAGESGSAGGTAFLALRRLEDQGHLEPADRTRLRELARAMVANRTAGEPTRMAALEVLRAAGDTAALPAARALLKENPSMAAAIAALGTIGALGGAGDAQWLKNDNALASNAALQPALAKSLSQLNRYEQLGGETVQ